MHFFKLCVMSYLSLCHVNLNLSLMLDRRYSPAMRLFVFARIRNNSITKGLLKKLQYLYCIRPTWGEMIDFFS